MPVISCLDIGDKIDPSRLEVADISRTTVCPAARIIKKELRKQGIRKLKVLYSREQPAKRKAFQTEKNYGEEACRRKYFLCDRDCGISAGGRSCAGYTVSRKRFTQLTANEKLSADHGQIQFMSMSQGGTVMSALQK